MANARSPARAVSSSVLLYNEDKSIWRQGKDSGGEIDVAVIELERAALPKTVAFPHGHGGTRPGTG